MKANFICKLSGAVIAIAAIIFTGITCSWWQFGYNIDNAWILLVAAPFLLWMLVFGVNFINSFGFFSGLGLLIYHNGFVPDDSIPVFIGIMAAFAAATALIGGSFRFIKPTSLEPVTISRVKPVVRVFAGMKHIRNNFDGVIGAAFKVFSGSLLYDFRKAKIESRSQLTVNVNFGRLYLVFPSDVLVESTVKGDFTNGLAAPKDYSTIISISGRVRFGKLYIIRSNNEN
ncbi:MAG: hypothetical protein Q4F95_14910 [Oscillospiraceae bacterium]|nr:hypothetical protein [Oscillospiraceae bacterium]